MSALEPNSRVASGDEGDVTGVAGEALELARDADTVSLGEPAGGPNVLPGAVSVPALCSLPRERGEAIDSLLGNAHVRSSDSDGKDVPKNRADRVSCCAEYTCSSYRNLLHARRVTSDVYRKGHYGVSLLVFAPIGFGLIFLGEPAVALLTGGVMLWLAMLPDVDHRLPLIEHRGPTHSLLFAVLLGSAFAGLGFLLGNAGVLGELLAGEVGPTAPAVGLQFATLGFFVGFITVLAHLLGDALTPAGVNFLWPVSRRTYSLYVTRADSTFWNYGLLAGGVIVAGVTLYLASLVAVS